MYHPAAALHQQKLRQVIEDDMRKIPEVLADSSVVDKKDEKKEERPEQLSMF